MTSEEYLKRKLREELLKANDSKLYEEVKKLHEGLIKSHSIFETKKILGRLYTTIGLSWMNHIVDRDDGTIVVDILPFKNDVNYIKNLLKYINNMGYFPSVIYKQTSDQSKPDDDNYDENLLLSLAKEYNLYNVLCIVIEAKYDVEVSIKHKLYHTTRQEVLHKIMKNGLTPREKSKLSTHPERVYLALTYSDAYDLVVQLKTDYVRKYPERYKTSDDVKMCILEIDPINVKYLKLFSDPNFKDNAVYTLMNIPKEAIKIIKENI